MTYDGPINMGRLQRIHRHRKQRRTALEARADTFESEPELSRGRRTSEAWSSHEEEESSVSLPVSPSLSLTSLTIPSCSTKTDVARTELEPSYFTPHSPDEMEVTRKLSSLNFSMAMRMCMDGEDSGNHGQGPGLTSILHDLEEVLSETELCSELTSATQLDLLPSLSNREIGEEEMEGLDAVQKRARKRPSRRKPTRRTKKQRSLMMAFGGGYGGALSPKAHRTPFLALHPSSNTHPLSQNFVRISSKESPLPTPPSPGGEGVTRRISRARSFRRPKRSKPVEEDPLFFSLSDTSVAPDVDPPSATGSCPRANQEMERMESCYEAKPSNEEMEETLPNESDFTETTTDSGCDGDDEESSVEGPVRALMLHVCGAFPPTSTARPHFTSSPRKWGDQGEGPSDETFHHIMKGPLPPLISPEGRYKVEQVQTSLLEFKHPGLRRLLCSEGGGRDGGGKKRCNPRQLSNPLSLREVNQRIVDFIQQQQQKQQQDLCSGSSCNDTTLELKFLFLSRAMCRTIVSLAQAYQLACLVEEHKRRLPVASPRLRMTEHTKIATREEIEPILWKHRHKETAATHLGRAGRERPASLSRESRSGSALIPSAGVSCRALDESNIGNQMLQGMGWSPGMDLGPHCGGIRSPVKALRTKHLGLGFM